MVSKRTGFKAVTRHFIPAIILILAIICFSYGCGTKPKLKPKAEPESEKPSVTAHEAPPALPKAALERLLAAEYPQFTAEVDATPLLISINKSLAYLKKLPADRQIEFGDDAYPVSHVVHTLEEFADIIQEGPTAKELNQLIREKFRVYQSVGRTDQKEVLFTGYYEPLLMAGRTQTSEFKTPAHSKPIDMVEINLALFSADLQGRTIVGQYIGKTVVPYPTRKEIRTSTGFNTKAPPVAWLRDEIDLLILQIQGSGRVKFANGEQCHILYNGSNGRPYRSIGRLLIDRGLISPEQMSMQAIRSFLKRHPEMAHDIMDHNPRYIFFKTSSQGPLGSLGQPLTPMRSLAVDRAIMPSAALAFITTPLPKVDVHGKIVNWGSYNGFALAQDAGSAIKGPGRVDLFMGHGLQAEVGAGHLKHPGKLYFLILNPQAP